MKRAIRKTILFLLLGAAANVAAAWICAATSCTSANQARVRACKKTDAIAVFKDGGIYGQVLRFDGAGWSILEIRRFSRVFGFQETGNSNDVVQSWSDAFRVMHADDDERHRLESDAYAATCRRQLASGLPCSAFWGEYEHFAFISGSEVALGSRGTLTIPGRSSSELALPCYPIWSGLVVNTIFYAASCWLAVAAPSALRRRRRIKRGLCPSCAYPLGASDRCTECGNVLNRKSQARSGSAVDPRPSTHPLTPSLQGRGSLEAADSALGRPDRDDA